MQIRRPLTVRHSRSISDASNFSRKSNEEPGGNIRNQTLSKLNMLLESMATFDQDSLTTFHGNASLKKKVAELGRFISQCELKTTSADPPLYSEHLKNCREMINFLDNKMDQRTSFIPSETVIAQMALLMDSILKDIAGVREESRSASTAESCVIKADNVLSNIIQLLLEDARVASRKQGMDPDKSITKAEGTTSLVDTDRLTEMQRELQAKMRSALERKNVVVDDKPDTRVYEELPYDVVIQKKGLDVNNLEVQILSIEVSLKRRLPQVSWCE
ncbi:hypothetical protein EDD86DRAFT_4475 [Gorgonomyces haynaldii]|nr:hypothetical protein EDD86DRAFT_4475 [Gorgonomyces haynaldii]